MRRLSMHHFIIGIQVRFGELVGLAAALADAAQPLCTFCVRCDLGACTAPRLCTTFHITALHARYISR